MGTKILIDIHNDLKLLIAAISGFEEGEEGFQICERFALSQIKHHRYLSVNSHAVKKEIEEITQKFLIHGKYDVAKEFQELVRTFLTSFDFERHPQYDLQWSLLSLLLNLSNETNKSEVSTSYLSRDRSQNVSITAEDDMSEEIDWAQYLKEGQAEFFCNYESDSDSDWSTDENDGQIDLSIQSNQKASTSRKDELPTIADTIKVTDSKTSNSLPQDIVSKNWLKKNVQNTWWNELDWHQYKVASEFETAHFYEIWRKNIMRSNKIIGTLSEYQACRELLWMFHIPTSMAIFQEENDKDFSIRDVSIPSLSSVAFKNMLIPFCEYFTMIREIDLFLEKLFKQNDSYKPPLTYEAYAIALQQELLDIKKGFVEVEVELMTQNDQKTFLVISRSLEKYLNRLKLIYKIHKNVTEDWEKLNSWQCASKLLSKLYFKMQDSNSIETINLCAMLYLSSLSVYLNIVDIWLSEGRLEDWRDEFVIVKCNETIESCSREDSRPLEGFTFRELDPLCLKDPIMNVLVHKVYQFGRSIELLVTLDRMSDFWNMMDKEKVARNKLSEEYFKEILNKSSKYDYLTFTDTTDAAPLTIIEVPVRTTYDSEIAQSVIQQVSASNNPFLTKALESFIFEDQSTDSIDAINFSSSQPDIENCKLFDFLSKLKIVLPWRRIFEYGISRVLEMKFTGASKLVKEILVREYKLEVQLKLMRSVYMMETNHVMNNFCKLIFTEIESRSMWNNAYYVSCLLEEVLTQEWPDSSSRWSVTVSNTRTTKILEAIDGVKLDYAAGWPSNMLLNDEALDKYNRVFRFELKLKWALWTLNNLQFTDLEGTDTAAKRDIIQHFHIRRLESLRFWLLHAIGSIHAYLSGQVLLSLGSVLDKSLSLANDLETIITVHNEYLDNVQEHCLQTEKFKDLAQIIHKLLEMCDDIRSNWSPKSLSFIGKVLDQLENDYVKHHTSLALGLHNAVQHKDADYLTGLSSAFNCSMPST
ncbi:gamma-tubulin complex component 5 isoform X2 [Phymastichus coffea]|uniref:gamma-tubulin complex component 5 isoform X2 n=1 Tax=Phymastichus coffea TaxID=108790 RepID=UPI00273B78BE|nr:gamma-tubulin complex component 5 isoform X2 [Phymastichus coffea]